MSLSSRGTWFRISLKQRFTRSWYYTCQHSALTRYVALHWFANVLWNNFKLWASEFLIWSCWLILMRMFVLLLGKCLTPGIFRWRWMTCNARLLKSPTRQKRNVWKKVLRRGKVNPQEGVPSKRVGTTREISKTGLTSTISMVWLSPSSTSTPRGVNVQCNSSLITTVKIHATATATFS